LANKVRFLAILPGTVDSEASAAKSKASMNAHDGFHGVAWTRRIPTERGTALRSQSPTNSILIYGKTGGWLTLFSFAIPRKDN
jgi:hypothetical protein